MMADSDTDTLDGAPTFELLPIEEIQSIKGLPFPKATKFRQLIVTGPPGSGKSKLIRQIGGWPEEGYIDLTLKNWWRAQSLTFRPREINLGFPFVGYDHALAVFEKAWLEAPTPPRLDHSRILTPPPKTHFLSTDWHGRFVFEFLIPPAAKVFEWRLARRRQSVHPVDRDVTLDQVENQVAVYREAALHFKRAGLMTYLRDSFDGIPKSIVLPAKED